MPAGGCAPTRSRPSGGTVYLEFAPVGEQLRVAAVDAATGIEVVVFGPASASRADFERIALRKLERRLAAER